jgi:hypothetical protein
MSIKMIRGFLKFKHTRQLFFTPRIDILKESLKPHEIAESEELDIDAVTKSVLFEGERKAHITLSGMNGVMIPIKPSKEMKWTTSIS